MRCPVCNNRCTRKHFDEHRMCSACWKSVPELKLEIIKESTITLNSNVILDPPMFLIKDEFSNQKFQAVYMCDNYKFILHDPFDKLKDDLLRLSFPFTLQYGARHIIFTDITFSPENRAKNGKIKTRDIFERMIDTCIGEEIIVDSLTCGYLDLLRLQIDCEFENMYLPPEQCVLNFTIVKC